MCRMGNMALENMAKKVHNSKPIPDESIAGTSSGLPTVAEGTDATPEVRLAAIPFFPAHEPQLRFITAQCQRHGHAYQLLAFHDSCCTRGVLLPRHRQRAGAAVRSKAGIQGKVSLMQVLFTKPNISRVKSTEDDEELCIDPELCGIKSQKAPRNFQKASRSFQCDAPPAAAFSCAALSMCSHPQSASERVASHFTVHACPTDTLQSSASH